MTAPDWVIKWLDSVGISVSEFLRIFEAAAKKFDLPTDIIASVTAWVEANVTTSISPGVILAFVSLAVAELKSGRPGYNPEAGGLA